LQIEIGEGVDVRTRVPEPDPVEMDGAVESSGDRDQILAVGSLDRTASAQQVADSLQSDVCLLVTIEHL